VAMRICLPMLYPVTKNERKSKIMDIFEDLCSKLPGIFDCKNESLFLMHSLVQFMGHECIISTQRYAKVSNTKVRRDYFKAMELVMARTDR